MEISEYLLPPAAPTPPSPPSPPPSSKSKLIIGMFLGAAVLIGATVVGAAALGNRSSKNTLTGTLTVRNYQRELHSFREKPCFAKGGYSDISNGGQVVVRDDENKILATGALGSGHNVSAEVIDHNYEYMDCEFSFEVRNIPEADFYSIKIGRRDEITYTANEMKERGWNIVMTLG